MIQTILKIDGMMCGMCEAHINDAIRRTFAVNKVTSSHTKGEAVIISEAAVDEDKVRAVISETGYELKGIESKNYEKKGILAHFGMGRGSR